MKWLKEFKPKQYWFLMKEKGLAKDLYIQGLKAQGIPIKTAKINKKTNGQLSMFDEIKEEQDEVEDSFGIDVDNMSPDEMEFFIQKRPCKFQDNVG